MAVRLISLVCPTSAAEMFGVNPSFLVTCPLSGAFVTSCSSVSTSVGEIVCWVPEMGTEPLAGCTSSSAVAEYCFFCTAMKATATATLSTVTAKSQGNRRPTIWR